MQVEKVRNTTTQESPVRYEVTIRFTAREMIEQEFCTALVETIIRAVRGIQ